MIHWQRMMSGFMHAFVRLCVCSCMHVSTFMLESSNLPVNWPKLLGLFQEFYHIFSMCIYSECHSTSLPVQRSLILIF